MNLNEIILVVLKTLFCYLFLFSVLRIMGKREVGEISTFDMVVFLVISEFISLSLNQVDTSILLSIIPITIIVILQLITAKASLKSKKIRTLLEGKSSYLIINGKINYLELKKNRYSLSDLLFQLRQKDIYSLKDVKFALLESNGTLSILKNDDNVIYPEPIIEEGEINLKALEHLNLSYQDIIIEIAKLNYHHINEIYYMEKLSDGSYFIIDKKMLINKN